MSYLPPLPPALQQVEYVKLYFHLQVKGYFDLPQLGLLQLRRELMLALRTLEGWGNADSVRQIKELLQPTLSTDPQIRRQAQKPAPAFVCSPDIQLHGLFQPNQRIVLPVLFVGSGVQMIEPFISLLRQLGQQGLYHGHGQFLLEAVESEDATGVRMMLWSDGQHESLSPPVSDLYWLLERQRVFEDNITLDVMSPMRLLNNKKPLFKADFSEMFPFVLRRVFSMLSSHAGVELFTDPQRYIDSAREVTEVNNSLKWQDWRRLQGEQTQQDLGGLLGELTLEGSNLPELLWILQLGSLFNIGKGAAYGSGQFSLING